VVAVERLDEALDLVLHVGRHQPLEVTDERLGPAIELLVEALDEILLEDAGAGPLAVGAPQRDLPVRRTGLVPLGRVDQVGVARAADVKVGGRRRGRRGAAVGGDAGGGAAGVHVVEVDDLDGLPRGEDDAADVVLVFGVMAHGSF
jgi:hypothetical protein